MGLKVIITSSSDEKLARARNMGANSGINYKSTRRAGGTEKGRSDRGPQCRGTQRWPYARTSRRRKCRANQVTSMPFDESQHFFVENIGMLPGNRVP
jgi:hypothetical protein